MGYVIDTPEGIAFHRLCTLHATVKLECLGMRHSRGSVTALVKREFGLPKSMRKVEVRNFLKNLIEQAIADGTARDGVKTF